LAVSQPLRRSIKPIGAGKQLLTLLKLYITRIVRIARAKESRSVGGERSKLALCGINIGLVVAEALVDLGTGCGGDILLLEAHLIELEGKASV
jgi:hypothetical protein